MLSRETMMRVAATMRPIPVTVVATAAFVGLNIADAWLTTQLLAHKGVEAFWWSAHYNSNMVIKGFLSLLVAAVLIRWGQAKLLKWLNIAMLFVILSNGLCFLGYFTSWFYWQTRIATLP